MGEGRKQRLIKKTKMAKKRSFQETSSIQPVRAVITATTITNVTYLQKHQVQRIK